MCWIDANRSLVNLSASSVDSFNAKSSCCLFSCFGNEICGQI
jgi:hypothetical protein